MIDGPRPDLAIFVSYSGQGGVEQVINNLVQGLAADSCHIDLLLIKAKSLHLKAFPEGVNVIKLESNHSATALPELVRYLKQRRPPVLMAVRHRALKIAVIARLLSQTDTRIVGQIHTTASVALTRNSRLKKALWELETRIFYRMADKMIGVSKGVADDIRQMARLPAEKVAAIYNPIITPALQQLAQEEVDHPWFNDHQLPVIISAGRLTAQKDFPTLIRAFARLQQNLPSRLLILGDGGDRSALEALTKELNLAHAIDLHGHVDNPFAWMRNADLFVLSSIWEGFGNVLAEALAVGTPVVATDCPNGPREILQSGRYGKLVPPGDPAALATAITDTLSQQRQHSDFSAALVDFTIASAARHYAQILRLGCAENE